MLSIPALAAAMMIGSAGVVLAQSSAPMPTGSAGNSNTGPGAKPPVGATETTPTTTRRRATKATRAPRNAAVRATTPMPTGSAGNSNTGPGAKPPQ
jgi:hypothetical protein